MTWSRRAFLKHATSCSAHLGLMAAGAPWFADRLWAQERYSVVAREPWGRLERIADGVWALVSTPLGGDRERGSHKGYGLAVAAVATTTMSRSINLLPNPSYCGGA